MFLNRGKHLTGSVNALQTIPGEISLGPEDKYGSFRMPKPDNRLKVCFQNVQEEKKELEF